MKKLMSLMIVAVMLFCTSCTEKSEKEVTAPEQSVMMTITYTNFAWEYQFDGVVISSAGNYYDLGDDFDMSDENVYENLEEVIQNSTPSRYIDRNDLDKFYEFMENMEQYSKCEYVNRGNIMCDYGSRVVRGYYTDENGEVQSVVLCVYGDNVGCIDNKEVVKFVNWMSKNEYVYFMDYKF